MALEVQQIHRLETTRMAMYMMENKNDKQKLQLNYKYQSLSYCLLSRSILGCFAISRLWGSPWWTFNLRVHFDQISKILVHFSVPLSSIKSHKPAPPPSLRTATYYFAVLGRGGGASLYLRLDNNGTAKVTKMILMWFYVLYRLSRLFCWLSAEGRTVQNEILPQVPCHTGLEYAMNMINALKNRPKQK